MLLTVKLQINKEVSRVFNTNKSFIIRDLGLCSI